MKTWILLAALAVLSLSTRAGDWFNHPFGEIRAYHGDWLVVCEESGMGPCRAVQTLLEPGETRVGPTRMALERQASGDYWISVFDMGLPVEALDPLIFDFDGEGRLISSDDWAPGEPGRPKVLFSFNITDPTLSAELIERMRAGRQLVIRYPGGEAPFSLRGVTAALTAIERHLAR